MSQAGLVPLIAAWLRDTQGVEPGAYPKPPPPAAPPSPPRAPFDLRAPSMYTQDVPRPAYPGPSAADLVRGDQPTITATQRAALRSEAGAEPAMERMTGPVEPLVAGGGKALWNVGKAATQGVGPLVRELAKLGYVREPILEAGKSRLGYGTKSGKAETEASRAKLAAAEAAVAPVKKIPEPHRGEYTPAERAYITLAQQDPDVKRADWAKAPEMFEKGEKGRYFYNETGEDMARRFTDPRDAAVAMKMQASSAIGTEPKWQAPVALEAARRYKLGLPIDESIFQYAEGRGDPRTRGNILAQLNRIAQGGEPSGPKILPYEYAMTGDPHAWPWDRWMNRDLFGRESITDRMRMVGTQEGRDLAAKMKLPARELQAGIWAGGSRPQDPEDFQMRVLISNAIAKRPEVFKEIPGFQLLDADTQFKKAMQILATGGVGAAAIGAALGLTPGKAAAGEAEPEPSMARKVFGR